MKNNFIWRAKKQIPTKRCHKLNSYIVIRIKLIYYSIRSHSIQYFQANLHKSNTIKGQSIDRCSKMSLDTNLGFVGKSLYSFGIIILVEVKCQTSLGLCFGKWSEVTKKMDTFWYVTVCFIQRSTKSQLQSLSLFDLTSALFVKLLLVIWIVNISLV